MPNSARRGPYLTPVELLAERPPFAIELSRRRIGANLTQRELSTLARIDTAYISAYENGRLTPGPGHLARLREALEWTD